MQHFDFNEALKAIQAGKPITGSDGVLAPLIKQLTEAALSAEIESYLGQNLNSNNRRNGYSKKTVKSALGSFELETPRERNGEFEPVLVKKHQTKLSPEIDNRILSLASLFGQDETSNPHFQSVKKLDTLIRRCASTLNEKQIEAVRSASSTASA